MARYYKVTAPEAIFATDEIQKSDLIDVKAGFCEVLIDTQTDTFFDAHENVWKPIKRIQR